jgi:hypothetical protein
MADRHSKELREEIEKVDLQIQAAENSQSWSAVASLTSKWQALRKELRSRGAAQRAAALKDPVARAKALGKLAAADGSHVAAEKYMRQAAQLEEEKRRRDAEEAQAWDQMSAEQALEMVREAIALLSLDSLETVFADCCERLSLDAEELLADVEDLAELEA